MVGRFIENTEVPLILFCSLSSCLEYYAKAGNIQVGGGKKEKY